MRILVVDDDRDILRIVERSLKGHAVVTAPDAASGLAAARAHAPDVILLDYQIPGADPPAFIATSIPVILFTASADSADVRAVLDFGARGVIEKPFDPATLAREITRTLDRP